MINCIAGTSLWFCPKNVLLNVGKFEDSKSKQDSILLVKLLGKGYNVYRVPENLVYYYEHGENGISGTKKRNIEGLLNYRRWCRKYYDKITDKQIKNVEYNFSKQLITLYIINDLKIKAIKEFRNMVKLKPLKKETIISFGKIIFSKRYILFLNNKK